MKTIFILSLLCLLLPSVWAKNNLKITVPLTPAGSFEAVSTRLKGRLKPVNGVLQADKFSVSVNSLKTGIDLRDEHLWKHLNYKQHPKIILSNVKAQNGKGTGILEVNGVKKPIQFAYTTKGDTHVGKFKVSASSFQLPKAQYMGVGVEDVITVEVSIPNRAK